MSFLLFRTRFYCSDYPSVTCDVPFTVTAKQVSVSQAEIAPSVSRNTRVTPVQAAGPRAGAVGGFLADPAVFQQWSRTSPARSLGSGRCCPWRGGREQRAGTRCGDIPEARRLDGKVGLGIVCYPTPSCSRGSRVPGTPRCFGVAGGSVRRGSRMGTVGRARETDTAREPGGGCPGAPWGAVRCHARGKSRRAAQTPFVGSVKPTKQLFPFQAL